MKRASYFVEPRSLGDGRIELIELSTEDETNDNIVASGRRPSRRSRASLHLRLSHNRLSRSGPALAQRARDQHLSRAAARAGLVRAVTVNARRFLVDFAGGDMAYYVPIRARVEVVATATNGQILRTSVIANSISTDCARCSMCPSSRAKPPICACFARGDADAHGDMDYP